MSVKILEVREKTHPIASAIANAYIDFSQMTASVVAVVTDVMRNGKPVRHSTAISTVTPRAVQVPAARTASTTSGVVMDQLDSWGWSAWWWPWESSSPPRPAAASKNSPLC